MRNNPILKKIFSLLIVLLIILIKIRHEPWRDEYQIYNFLKYYNTISDLWEESSGELTSILWYLINKILAEIVNFNIYSWLITIPALILIFKTLQNDSVNILFKIYICLPQVWYQYVVISRNYTILLTLILLFINLKASNKFYKKKQIFILAALNSIGIYGLIFSSFYFIYFLFKFKSKNLFQKEFILFYVTWLLGVVAVIWGSKLSSNALKANSLDFWLNFNQFVNNQLIYFFGIPIDTFHFWDPRQITYLAEIKNILALLSFLLILIFLFEVYANEKKLFYITLLIILFYSFWFVYVFQGAERHWGLLTLNLFFIFIPNYKRIIKIGKISFIYTFFLITIFKIIFFISLFYALILIKSEVNYPFSTVKNLSVNKNQLQVIFYPSYLSISYNGGQNFQGYFVQGDYYGVFKGSNSFELAESAPIRFCNSSEIYLVTVEHVANELSLQDLGIIIDVSIKSIEKSEGDIYLLKLKDICQTVNWKNFINVLEK